MRDPSAAPTPAVANAAAERLRGRLMQESLGALLDRVRGARDVLTHLAALEAGLRANGTKAIGQIPPASLARICSQLSSLPLPADDGPLQDLMTRLLDALGTPPAPASIDTGPDVLPFDDSRMLDVQEATLSAFDAAMAAQACTRPMEF